VPARRGGHPQCRSSMQRKPQTTDSRIPTLPVSGTAAAVAGAGRETPASVGVSSSACTCRRRFRVGREGGAGSGSARQPSLARDPAPSTRTAPNRPKEQRAQTGRPLATARIRETAIRTRGVSARSARSEVGELLGFMARARIELATPRFSVKELEVMIWPWLQGLS
jgi:hypothetical protein